MGNKPSRSASAAQQALDALLNRSTMLKPDMFALESVAHHGVPSNARTLAFCGAQGLLAVGTAGGAVKLYGQERLEVLLPAPSTQTSLTVGVTHMQFTAHQRLVVAYTDSSLRIFSLATDATGADTTALILAEVPASWTTSVVTGLETIAYTKFPFFFVATDDGDVHVVHEDTGRVSSYVIRPQDLSVAHAEGITALASHPRDSNQLLLAYDTCPFVLLWDFAKRKVVREFSLSGKSSRSASLSTSSSFGAEIEASAVCNSPQSLSWHSSGKRFVAGFKLGGFAVFRLDKPHGIYRRASDPIQDATPITSIKWVCAPPTSRSVHLPGAIVFSGGSTSTAESNLLTLVAPPNDGTSGDDVLSELLKSERLTWQVKTIESTNHAEIAAFAVAQDQVDDCPKMAPFSLAVLSGNPLDGCLPAVSVQCLPCFIKLCEGDKEEWEWRLDRLPEAAVVPPLLQMSSLKTFEVVNLSCSDGNLQDDLFSTWEQERHDPMFRVLRQEDFDWPINGGSVLEPTLKGFLSTSGALDEDGQKITQNSTLLVTGHANGYVLFWEILPPADRSSKGTLRLLHVADVPVQMDPVPSNKEITSLSFCAGSRMLVAGFVAGEVAVLQLGHWKQPQVSSHMPVDGGEGPSAAHTGQTGFRALFSIHVHTEAISKIVLSSVYGYVAVADAVGTVSLVELATQDFKLLIFDLAPTCDDSMTVDSMLMSELVQTTEIPGSSSSRSASQGTKNGGTTGGAERNNFSGKAPRLSRSASASTDAVPMIQHREVVPVLFVGRGSGKLEMYHVQSATKIWETLVDPQRATSLSSIIMVDADGKRIEIPGRVWVDQEEAVATSSPIGSAVSAEMVKPHLVVTLGIGEQGSGGESPHTQPVHASSAEFAYTKQVVLETIQEQSDSPATDTVVVQNEDSLVSAPGSASSWNRESVVVEAVVPAGSLGLHLSMEIEQYAMVTGFVEESSTAAMLKAKGVRAGHVVTSINGVELASCGRNLVGAVLDKLHDREKVIAFAVGSEDDDTTGPSCINADGSDDLLADGKSHADVERPRFLVCTCGKTIHLVQVSVPRAAEMALGPKKMPAQPLASVELQAAVLVTSVVRVPAGEGVENCLAAIDQSNHVYVLSLLTLQVVWETEYLGFGFALGRSGFVDDILADITYGGELVVANGFGEMERFSLLAEPTAKESAMLERKSITTRLLLPERAPAFDRLDSPSACGSGKKRGIASDAGKMFKKLVLSVTQEATDLNKLFQFSTEEDERSRLMGGRTAAAAGALVDAAPMAQAEQGANATKDALMQAQQRLAERGDKLNDLGLKTEQMKQTSADFYQTMKAFNDKNANKKWYEL